MLQKENHCVDNNSEESMEKNKKESRYVNLSGKTANLASFSLNTEFLQVSEMEIDFFLGTLTPNVIHVCQMMGLMFHSIY